MGALPLGQGRRRPAAAARRGHLGMPRWADADHGRPERHALPEGCHQGDTTVSGVEQWGLSRCTQLVELLIQIQKETMLSNGYLSRYASRNDNTLAECSGMERSMEGEKFFFLIWSAILFSLLNLKSPPRPL